MAQSQRYNEDKPKLSYILTWPNAIRAVARVCMEGEKKYTRFNYKVGAPLSEYIDCTLRHMAAFYGEGKNIDAESGCEHLAHAVWNLLQALEVHITQPERDDRWKKPEPVAKLKEQLDILKGYSIQQRAAEQMTRLGQDTEYDRWKKLGDKI